MFQQTQAIINKHISWILAPRTLWYKWKQFWKMLILRYVSESVAWGGYLIIVTSRIRPLCVVVDVGNPKVCQHMRSWSGDCKISWSRRYAHYEAGRSFHLFLFFSLPFYFLFTSFFLSSSLLADTGRNKKFRSCDNSAKIRTVR